MSLHDSDKVIYLGHKNEENGHQLKKIMIVKQILLVSNIRNV